MGFNEGAYKIEIAGEWEFEDLAVFTAEYQKLYSYYYHLLDDKEIDDEEIFWGRATGAFNWQGGYSTVNFFKRLRAGVPHEQRPRLKSIQYASPGWLELQAGIEVLERISTLTTILAVKSVLLFECYKRIQKGLSELRLNKISAKERDLEIADRYVDFISPALNEISSALGEPDTNRILELAPNKLAALKIKLTVVRRFKPLIKLEENGQLRSSENRRSDE